MRTSWRLCSVALLLLMPECAQLQAQGADQQAVIELLRSAGEAARRGDTATSETLFKRVIATAPNLSDGHLGLGMVQLRESKPEEASHELARATELNPQLPGAHLYFGIARYQAGQVDAAVEAFQSETLLQPRHSEAFTWLGIVELNQKRPELAVVSFDRAKALEPNDPQILYYCGRAHTLVAEANFQSLRDLDPDSALVHRALAESFDMGAQPEKAAAEYEAAVRRDGNNADLYEALGEADLKISRKEAAQQAYEQALKLNPYSGIALYNLGRLDVESGKPGQGVDLLRRADAVHASVAPTAFYLGLGLVELGRNEEAARSLERSLANQPSPFIAQSAYYQLTRVYQRLGRKTDAQKALAELTRLKAEAVKATTQAGDRVQASTPVATGDSLHPGR